MCVIPITPFLGGTWRLCKQKGAPTRSGGAPTSDGLRGSHLSLDSLNLISLPPPRG